jgi:hypothetical protein
MLPLIPLDPAAVGTVPNRLDRLPDELQLEIVRLSALSDDGVYDPFQLRRSLDELCERRPRLCDDSDGLRFCNSCKRCVNRDANSAPQMAVQLKRLLIGLGPLHRVSSEDAELQRMTIDTEG